MVHVEFPEPAVAAHGGRLGHFTDDAAFERFKQAYTAAAAALPGPTGQQSLDTSFGQVRAYEFGPATDSTLVLLSGRNASTPTWARNLPSLAQSRRVVSMDAVGEAGCSTHTAPLTSGADHAQWIDEAVEQLDAGSVHLVGHSLGGWMAMQAAIHRPARLRSVTVLDPAATFARLSAAFIAVGMLASVSRLPRAVRGRLLGWIAGDGDEDGTVARLGITALETYRVRQPPPAMPTREQLAAVAIPVLTVIAGRSRVHRARVAADRAGRLPAGRLELWQDAPHALTGRFPERLSTLLDEFVADVEEGRQTA